MKQTHQTTATFTHYLRLPDFPDELIVISGADRMETMDIMDIIPPTEWKQWTKIAPVDTMDNFPFD